MPNGSRLELESTAFTIVIAFSTIVAGQGYRADQAAAKMTVPEGFTVKLVASEPEIRKPVAIDFDERGRLWVMQYLQYPNPAGLKRVKVDRFSRTVYDKIPEPPPRGPKGADKLTILKPDPDKPGQYKPVDFVSGLNLASGFAFGHGGVFVLQAPYLLFYSDKDRDDVPDGDPEVLLTGFGMEDAHSVANSLTWGPDGWLYGCQGSTVTAKIRGIEFQQGVWRYHPITRKFELFCEGGGNMWGLDFDRHGNLFCSTNVGGHVMLHGVQGAYYWKSFGKHGELHNPYAYGYFDHVPHQNFKGGHVTVGGIVYRGDAYPAKFRDKYIAADLLGHAVYWNDIEANGSTFMTKHGGDLLLANDTWFAPSDVCLGPDGCVYVADWHDKRTAHPDPDADWDRGHGRIYRIEYKGESSGVSRRVTPFDLAKLKSEELIKLLSHPNDWYARMARRILAGRRDPEVIFPLRTLVMESSDENLQLQALWALYVSGGFSHDFAKKALVHSNLQIRRWALRFVGDESVLNSEVQPRVVRMAREEKSPVVLSQLAGTLQRLTINTNVGPTWGIFASLAENKGVDGDPHLPLLFWWAVEKHAIDGHESLGEIFSSRHDRWQSIASRETVLPRLIERFAAESTKDLSSAIRKLLCDRPDEQRLALLERIDVGLQERRTNAILHDRDVLSIELSDLWQKHRDDPRLIRVLAKIGIVAAVGHAKSLIDDSTASADTRVRLIALLPEIEDSDAEGRLFRLLGGSEPESIQLAAIRAIQSFKDGPSAQKWLKLYPSVAPKLKMHVRSALLSRKYWAGILLERIEDGQFPAKDFTIDELRIVATYNDPKLDALVRKHWGAITPPTPGEKLAEVRRFNNDLRAGVGNPTAGKVLFTKHCAVCHQLFGEGTKLGPDLTTANRHDRDYLLVSIVDASAVIRKEYLSYNIDTRDGRRLTGMVVEQAPEQITISDAKNQRTILPTRDIEAMKESPTSLMPDNLLKDLKPQELRDLFSYLQRK